MIAVILRPIQGSTCAMMDLDVKQRNSHYVVLQLENWYTNMKSLLIDKIGLSFMESIIVGTIQLETQLAV